MYIALKNNSLKSGNPRVSAITLRGCPQLSLLHVIIETAAVEPELVFCAFGWFVFIVLCLSLHNVSIYLL